MAGIRTTLLGAAAMAGALALAAPAAAKDCAELSGLKLDAGKVTSAELVAAGAFKPPASPFGPPPGVAASGFAALPAFCRVQATLTPTPDSDIKVEVWLPASGWNGKFAAVGNGVWAGSISFFQMGEPLSRGYAVAATDTGHVGNGLTADFAVGHPEKLVDFGHRAIHVMTVTAKAAIADFYGRGPRLSLWNSCSTGGRQGLMEAYRYPDDYDAIASMAPANPMTDLMTQSLWAGYQAVRTPGARLAPAKLALANKAWLARCDAKDGLTDGLVAQPGACDFDPATIQCKAADGPDCLTADQVQTLRAVYAGPPGLGGFPPGSEQQLAALMSGPEPFPVATSYMRQLVFAGQPGWDFRGFDYAKDAERARNYGAPILDVPATGLNRFFARGGKLLLSHGWADGLIPATNTLAFHDALTGRLPDAREKAQYRLFMIPGMAHCAGGDGPSVVDMLGAIDKWAEGGPPPERLVASRPPGQPAMSRPLCPWPQVAKYKGSGPAESADSFACTKP